MKNLRTFRRYVEIEIYNNTYISDTNFAILLIRNRKKKQNAPSENRIKD